MTVTGSVFPIGDGGVGKTALAKALEAYQGNQDDLDCVHELKKTVNMEFEFVKCECPVSDEVVLAQMYVPPGQKVDDQGSEIGTFDKVLDTYNFMPNMQNISTILLVYKINDFQTFASLEAWLETALMNDLVKNFTSVLLVGTHLDIGFLEIGPEQLEQALDFVRQKVSDKIPNWNAYIGHTVLSNINGRGVPELRKMLVETICISSHIRCVRRQESRGICAECIEKKLGQSHELTH